MRDFYYRDMRYDSIKRNIQHRESTYYYNTVIRIRGRFAAGATLSSCSLAYYDTKACSILVVK